MSKVIDLNQYRDEKEANLPVWRVVQGACDNCHSTAVSVQHEECPLDNTECPSCGNWAFCVTHFINNSDEIVPRLEVVR